MSEALVVTNIEGLDDLEDAFLNGSPRAVKKFLRRVEMKAAGVLVEALSEGAPYLDGELAADIHRQTITNSDGMTVRVGPSKQTFYGIFQEFGAPEANIPAQHWAEEAAKSVQDQVLEEYNVAVEEGLAELKK